MGFDSVLVGSVSWPIVVCTGESLRWQMSAQKPKAITQTCWPDQQKTSTEQNMSMSGAINIHYVWPHATNRVGKQHTHTHTYIRVYMYAQQGGRTKASLSFYGTAATCQQTARKSELYTQFPTHTHTLGQYLKSVTRRRSGNVGEIASRALRFGIEQ